MEKIVKLTMTIVLSIVSLGQICAFEQQKIAGLTDYQNERLQLVNDAFETIWSNINEPDQVAFALALVSWLQDNAEKYKIGENDPLGELELVEGFLAQTCGMAPWIIGSDATTLHEDITLSKYSYVYQNYRKARKALDDATPGLVLEEEQRIQTARAQMRASTFRLEKRLQKALAKWMEKGQLEKSADYQKRLQDKSVYAFDSICSKLLSDAGAFPYLYQELGDYDADKEEYSIEFYYKDDNYNKIHSVKGHFALSPSRVENVNSILRHTFSTPTGVELQRIDGYIYPKHIAKPDIDNNTFIDIIVDVPNSEKLSFDFDRLGIQNPYLSGHSLPVSTMAFHQSQIQIIEYLDSCDGKLVRLFDTSSGEQPSRSFYTEYLPYFRKHIAYKPESKFDYQSAYDTTKQQAQNLLEKIKYNVGLADELQYSLTISRLVYHYGYNNQIRWLSDVLPKEIVNSSFRTFGNNLEQKYVLWKTARKSSYVEIQNRYKEECHEYISINADEKVLKEYQKNSQYFNSEEDFIDAYLFSADYPDYQSAINGKSYKEELKKRKAAK